jgi:isoaspartyl peptidase/L-asparaginase-like protein (Ntn-hydrolase superfamily)
LLAAAVALHSKTITRAAMDKMSTLDAILQGVYVMEDMQLYIRKSGIGL